MPFNRELLASVKLESISDSDWLDEAHDKTNDGRSATADGSMHAPPDNANNNEGEEQNAATKNVIKCLKIALERGITSISLPEKQRPLNPQRDFTIEGSMYFKANARGGFECCGAASTNVKRPKAASSQMVNALATTVVTGSRYPQQQWRRRSELTQFFSGDGPDSNSDDDGGDNPNVSSTLSRLPHAPRRQQADYYRSLGAAPSGADRPRRPQRAFAKSRTTVDFSSSDDDDDDDEDAPPVDFTFTDYSPMCYRHIREFFNVDPKAYCDVLKNSRWHSIPTPGKSAAQLFFCGRDWVIKTMTDLESRFLREILHRYYYHARDNPYTLLPHFVGHHRLQMGAKTFNFIIMQNVFATTNTIHEKFDLKGSTIGRFASDAEKRRATCTQKDLDINCPLHVGNERRALLIDQIKKDCEFLKRSCIMDYSFLVGIYVLPCVADADAAHSSNNNNGTSTLTRSFAEPTMRAASTLYLDRQDSFGGDMADHLRSSGLDGRCFTAEQGGMMSNKVPGLRREIYYLGIIDILQEYNARKRLENVTFGAMYDRKRISCVNPSDYAARFIAFMSSIIV